MSLSRLRPSFTFSEDRIAELRAIIPEAFADGRINWDVLREALGDWVEADEPNAEHFGLTWPGKRDARRLAALPSRGTLAPVPGDGVDEETTRNVFIEGDNLEVLKLLQKSYAGRVKMIYIDPPYNTGNDFVYSDDFSDPIGEYLRKTGQVDEEGRALTTNKRADGRFHSNWLSMMYPRLLVARTVLSDDGLVFVSIDDNEAHHLRCLMDEIYGAEAFVAQLVWKSRQSEDARARTGVSTDHEYILCYRGSVGSSLRGTEKDLEKFDNPDHDPRGPWRSADLTGLATKAQRPNLHYPLIDPATGIDYGCPPKGWRYDPATMAVKITEGRVLFPGTPDGRPRHKLFLNEMRSLYKNISSVITKPTTMDGTRELNALLGPGAFDFPKPSGLLKSLIAQATGDGDLVLDLFSGSATTAHAVVSQNRDDGMHRRFLCVQLPEPGRPEARETVTNIGKRRIRRVLSELRDDANGPRVEDLGFRVYKLDRSNFRAWQDYDGTDVEELESLFAHAETPLVQGWNAGRLLPEVMLLEGFPLDSAITERRPERKQRAFVVEHTDIAHRLIACFDDAVDDRVLASLDLRESDVLVCLDSALSDRAKMVLAERCALRTI